MTREEATQILSTRDAHGALCGYTSGVTEAINMAIEALKQDTERHEAAIRASERDLGIVRCKDCKHRYELECPMYHEEWYTIDEGDGWFDRDFYVIDDTQDDGFCYMGQRERSDE